MKVMSQDEINDRLQFEAKYGNTEEVKKYLELGANVHFLSDKAVFNASENGHTDVVKVLIENGAWIYYSDDLGYTPIIIASKNGHVDVVKVLIENGASVNGFDNSKQTNPILSASENGHTDVVKVLIEHGADVNSNNGRAIKNATKNGHIQIVKLLHQNGADLSKAITSADDSIKDELKSYRTSMKEQAYLEKDLQKVKIQPQVVAPSRRI